MFNAGRRAADKVPGARPKAYSGLNRYRPEVIGLCKTLPGENWTSIHFKQSAWGSPCLATVGAAPSPEQCCPPPRTRAILTRGRWHCRPGSWMAIRRCAAGCFPRAAPSGWRVPRAWWRSSASGSRMPCRPGAQFGGELAGDAGSVRVDRGGFRWVLSRLGIWCFCLWCVAYGWPWFPQAAPNKRHWPCPSLPAATADLGCPWRLWVVEWGGKRGRLGNLTGRQVIAATGLGLRPSS